MSDTTIKKIDSKHSPQGEMGQVYLATGTSLSMRLWKKAPTQDDKRPTARDYETVGYVIEGRARLTVEEQTILLNPGDSWVVPKGARHTYQILEPFTAVEATCPPAHIHGRDDAPSAKARVH